VAETLSAHAVREQGLAQRKAAADHRIVICHATHSATSPYVEIEIDRNGLQGHADHAADLIPAPAGGCPRRRARVERAEVRGAEALDLARAAEREMADAARAEARAETERANARQEESRAKGSRTSSRTEDARAETVEKRAEQEHQAAAAEFDPTKAAQMERLATGDDRLADSGRRRGASRGDPRAPRALRA